MNHLANGHVCDDGEMSGARCPKNGFLVLPQASGSIDGAPVSIAVLNWNDIQSVPVVNRPASVPYVNFYSVPHFAVAVTDSIYPAQITGLSGLEPLASGNLNWNLGLNPGIPASKSASPDSAQPWQSASFTNNGTIPSVRTMEGWRTSESSSKGWLAIPREVSAGSPHHETWWIDPANNGFVSLVNGHVIWDGQWDYLNNGGAVDSNGLWFNVGWSSGETFLLDDGEFVKAALLLEDWLNTNANLQANPYPVNKLAFLTQRISIARTQIGHSTIPTRLPTLSPLVYQRVFATKRDSTEAVLPATTSVSTSACSALRLRRASSTSLRQRSMRQVRALLTSTPLTGHKSSAPQPASALRKDLSEAFSPVINSTAFADLSV
jgi:hypothetical protein